MVMRKRMVQPEVSPLRCILHIFSAWLANKEDA